MLSFSSCWNNARHSDGEQMIDEITQLGVEYVELSHGMTIAKLPGIRKAYQAGKFKCSGVHNYFPSPVEVMIDAPDAYEFTSHRGFERQRAMEMTLKTLELAGEFEAKYIVMHMGSVPMPSKKWTKKLTSMVREGSQLDPEYTKHKLAFVKKREKLSPLYYQRAIEALEELSEKAKEVGVPLAVESRSRYEDVPSEEEMIKLQEHFKDNPWVGYWHDFGHVQLKHNLGLLNHEQWLKKMQPYLIGCHVHDVYWPHRDHRVPLTGEMDFPNLMQYVSPEKPLVWELSPTRETEEIEQCLKVWKTSFPDHCERV
ncbi:sugar phosphate isomerase/epimerase family protein [Persicirhabdus sediminis]|uniref:Sugar phosphate isomerase/epimerase n=1 Tax=Persicirhabdus sediminis TaxID=454144 RepID=A0A8J7MD35_9BACT|nr:TIM barrel protein [Persicirhabdus sediminis]MBK1790318.1 sugar phosphate isomerase/epimerase [Persicirhabdus sediminis]